MKYFKCGKCESSYKLDPSAINTSSAVFNCSNCGAKNVIRLGPIVVFQNEKEIKRFSLKMGPNTIGRKSKEPSADILVNDEFMSRNHATIFVEEKDGKLFFSISDNNSTNGTFDKSKTRIKIKLKYPITLDNYYILGLTKVSIQASL
jgi:pSer/pThr/pTyr-binding forkhead associated (FHA) protein